MLSKLKGLFVPGSNHRDGPCRHRVNLQGRFRIVSETSRGSMSHVFRALDNENGRTICLKVQLRDKNEAARARASTHETKPAEGEIAIKMVHPHVVRTMEYGDSNKGEHYLVMEYIDGVSLQYIRETRSARTAQRIELLAQAAEGLAYVHTAGFIHHDINAWNFLVDREMRTRLIDFGLAVPNTPAFRKPGNRTGTLQYMAPELLRREPIDERIDVFAFGVLAYEFLTGRMPYEGGNNAAMMMQRINTDPIDPARARPQLSEELCEILRKLTARRKDQRWPSMSTLAQALRSVPAKRARV